MTANPTDPAEGTAFSGSIGTPSRRRVGLVLAGATILIIGAAATSFAASPAPNSSDTPSSGSSQTVPGAAGNGPAAAPDFGRFGRPGIGFRQITIASINGSDVTLKKLYRENGRVRLQPANPTMQPIFVDPNNVQIQGVVVGVMRKY